MCSRLCSNGMNLLFYYYTIDIIFMCTVQTVQSVLYTTHVLNVSEGWMRANKTVEFKLKMVMEKWR